MRHIMKTVSGIAEKNRIETVKFITLEVGALSGYVPAYLTKLYPIAADPYPSLRNSELRIAMVSGKGLTIKEIGY
ncbi:MAG: hypothetical protein IIV43_08665 [Oscillospiraceae bacterium]|nr:hypothetical protein [Oscillospiraceae bacterium]